MSGPERKRQGPKARLPILPPGLPGRPVSRATRRLPPPELDDNSIYSLRGYKAWAARVKAAWDSES
jgi:hypothetical protein